MYIIKNAFQNLFRNKGRNTLLGVVLFFIIAMAAISIVIQSAAGIMIDHYKAQFGSQVLIASENIQQNIRDIQPELLLFFGESELLQRSEFTAKTGYTAKGTKAFDEALEEGVSSIDGFYPKGTIYGSSQKEISEEFQNGTRIIVSGRKYQNESECLISKKFADLNGLSVGDSLTLENVGAAGQQEMVISGIYEDLSPDADTNFYNTAMGNRANDIFTELEPILLSSSFNSTGTLNAKFYLKNPSQLSAFEKELREKGLPPDFKVGTDEAGYRRIVEPVEGLRKVSTMFLIGVLALGSIILILISIMAIRERKYEVGVLRAMGMKKSSVALGMLSEVVIITLFCLILGLGTASWASKPIASGLLQNQIKLTEQASESDSAGNNAAKELSSLSGIVPRLDGPEIGWIILLSGALAVISSLSGILFITRYEPRKILSERE